MKKTYEKIAAFLRWVVAALLSFIVSLPTLVSLSVEI